VGRDGSVRIGCTGWAIPTGSAEAFPSTGSHLARYAGRLAAVEISSSFYRHHRPDTYARWAATVPPGFRFAVKLPRAVTHDARLGPDGLPALDRFLAEAAHLGDRLGPLLAQLPPSLAFDAARATAFFAALAARTPARSPASRATRRGSPARATRSWPGCGSPASPPIPPSCPPRAVRAGGTASPTTGCTGVRLSIARRTLTRRSPTSPGCSGARPPRRCGAASTTPRRGPPRATRSPSPPCWVGPERVPTL
jgi:hypothetical protein